MSHHKHGHVVNVHEDSNVSAVLADLPDDVRKYTHTELHEVNSFCVNKDAPTWVLDQLNQHRYVHSVERQTTFKHAFQPVTPGPKVQTTAPWGLARLSSNGPLGEAEADTVGEPIYTYKYNGSVAGCGVTVYMLDTGVMTDHEGFEDRVTAPEAANFAYPGKLQADEVGHGTFDAGIVASTLYGVAKKVKVVSVQVFGLDEVDNVPILAGINWVLQQSKQDEGQSIMFMPIEGEVNVAVERAVKMAIRNKVHVVVAAGNAGVDAGETSPARMSTHTPVISVGASRIDDSFASYSNFGPAVSLHAPGSSILSAAPQSSTASTVRSGTSPASAHVAGLLAMYLSDPAHKYLSPAEGKALLLKHATESVKLTEEAEAAETTRKLAHLSLA
ncbi:peptidase S8/S53 domain-containing protein [Protomyces lactucae-debilis]|uniref:Peptidase S8/S53 domain-containing protein n=1 Tax=Protomyces lactucae-debilis TaxID=2754530 RepID=A0A1Y2FF16_PROLT|nr:peptidase S8/S53 domain-containing protein [Protomyces lactucae-debilis]ORY82519.1 peptidase S8/S53 domain-containing protein [Protomyces lactucae-debilis]